ncbi:S-methyl-5'-thioinosine phosphorylase [Methylophaga sp. OBS3]|uniref:S-methyl-5'-thioinosine phosphorylase n=1 Tax=Methylophaga sp. OBS3 TaxID=2991934 RepID=UPI002258A383|nr:S-methyl-5'-thioinosine phosphorylase [Methylophaga sp. OBS3]MCX4190148.1 S-methyl-5'-thioinosine phosphorylase [Methylophaga sp. OBS3]
MIGIIGGSGLSQLPGLQILEQIQLETPFGEPSAPIIKGELNGQKVVFLPRHGEHHTIPPHLINYRANLWALHHLGVRQILAVAAVGGINELLLPGIIAIPDQIIDYTWGRDSSLFSETFSADKHIDFTEPYDGLLRQKIIDAASRIGQPVVTSGTYAVTQGPRLETAAEIRRLANDGADMVGMTAMPEAAIARELNVAYAGIAVVANKAAGLNDEALTMDAILETLSMAMDKVKKLITAVVMAQH